jgi:hypothetical protein
MRRRWRRDYAPQAENKQQRQQQGSDADCHVPSSPLLVAYERFWRELIWPEHLRYGCSYPEVPYIFPPPKFLFSTLMVFTGHTRPLR